MIFRSNDRKIVLCVLPAAACSWSAGIASAQSPRASRDNRSGTTLANHSISSGNPNTDQYNIDPSMLYIAITGNRNSSQTLGSNSAVAHLLVDSRFFGTNPATRFVSFRAAVSGSATVQRTTLTAAARSQDNTSFCINLSGASGSSPATVRVIAGSEHRLERASSLRFADPSNANPLSLNGNGSFNRVPRLTANVAYTVQMQGDTDFLNLSSGTSAVQATFSNQLTVTCPADFDGSRTLSVQDIFDYLNAWFTGCA